MRTLFRCLVAAAFAVLCAAEVRAAGADAAMSTLPNVRVVPSGGLIYQVTIRDAIGAVCPFVAVDLFWPPAAVAVTCVCPGSPIPLVGAVTNAVGVATFYIAAGGCINPATAGTGVDILVGGVFLATVGQVSPDFVDAAGAPTPNCVVGLADAVSFTGPISTGTYPFCTDLNSDLATSLTDAVLLTPFVMIAGICP
jgi:hypothetical protein